MDTLEKDVDSKDKDAKEQDGIKCRYMKAAREFLGNTTFHGISWVAEDVSRAVKVSSRDNKSMLGIEKTSF